MFGKSEFLGKIMNIKDLFIRYLRMMTWGIAHKVNLMNFYKSNRERFNIIFSIIMNLIKD